MQKATKFLLVLVLTISVMTIFSEASAQCPMCRSAVESAMQNEGNTVGVGLNKGILYLLASPYIIVLCVGGIYLRKYLIAKQLAKHA